MNDERRGSPAMPPFQGVGTGSVWSFLCAQCEKKKGCPGRRLRLVRGVRQFVCAACLSDAKGEVMTSAAVATIIAQPAVLPVFDWPIKRKTCEACTHCQRKVLGIRDPVEVIQCGAAPPQHGMAKGRAYCIDMRTDGGCGPEAKLFERAPKGKP